jgi:hypothetical protein
LPRKSPLKILLKSPNTLEFDPLLALLRLQVEYSILL